MSVVGVNGNSIRIQWPTVIHATAYMVDLTDQASMTTQRYIHVHPDGPLPSLMDVQVDGLPPSTYAACVRCVAPCGAESASSPFSFMQVGWSPPPPLAPIAAPMVPALQAVPANVAPAPAATLLSCPPPPVAPAPTSFPPAAAVLSTTLAPIPEEGAAADVVPSCDDGLILD